MTDDKTHPAEFAAAELAQAQACTLAEALAELEAAVRAGGAGDLERQVARLGEFHRLFIVRLASIVRQLKTTENASAEVGP